MTENNNHQHGVLCKLGWTSKHQQTAEPVIGSGWTNIARLLLLTSAKYFKSAAARADGILIPNLHKALDVGGKHAEHQTIL